MCFCVVVGVCAQAVRSGSQAEMAAADLRDVASSAAIASFQMKDAPGEAGEAALLTTTTTTTASAAAQAEDSSALCEALLSALHVLGERAAAVVLEADAAHQASGRPPVGSEARALELAEVLLDSAAQEQLSEAVSRVGDALAALTGLGARGGSDALRDNMSTVVEATELLLVRSAALTRLKPSEGEVSKLALRSPEAAKSVGSTAPGGEEFRRRHSIASANAGGAEGASAEERQKLSQATLGVLGKQLAVLLSHSINLCVRSYGPDALPGLTGPPKPVPREPEEEEEAGLMTNSATFADFENFSGQSDESVSVLPRQERKRRNEALAMRFQLKDLVEALAAAVRGWKWRTAKHTQSHTVPL